jgi:DNA-directed RNA polymerase specialized sigma24 family protein
MPARDGMSADRRAQFLQRYDQLLASARRVLGERRDQAQDLVHDAFVQFVLGQRPLDTIDNLDAYLQGMLRKLHLSRLRRAARHPLLSLADYDSALVGLHALDSASHVHALHDLAAIGRYACVRAQSSAAASVFILRFFWALPPPAIARVTHAAPMVVAQRLRRARIEARAALAAPQRLAFLQRDAMPPIVLDPALSMDEAHAAVLDAIVLARRGDCLSGADVSAIYAAAAAVPTSTLAHLASCPICLDRAVTHLWRDDDDGRPSMPSPGIGARDMGPGARGPNAIDAGSLGSKSMSARARPMAVRRAPRRETPERWLDAVRHHRPGELHVFANGFLVASHRIAGHASELAVSANVAEPLACVEVLSEQGVLLLFLDVEPPFSGSGEPQERVDFGDGRTLIVSLDFSAAWPLVRVRYDDPDWYAAPIRVVSPLAGTAWRGVRSAPLRTTVMASADSRATRSTDLPGSMSAVTDDSAGASPIGGGTWTRDDVDDADTSLRALWQRWVAGRFVWRFAFAVFLIWLVFGGGAVTLASAADRLWQWVASLATTRQQSQAPPPSPRAAPPAALAMPPPVASSPLPGAPAPLPVAPAAPAATALTDGELVGLELQVLQQLDEVDALLGDQIWCTRAAGQLVVSAVVESVARAQVLRRALAPLADRPGLVVRVRTAQELAWEQMRALARAPGRTSTPGQTQEQSPGQSRVQEPSRARDRTQAQADGGDSARAADGPVPVRESIRQFTVDAQRSAMQEDLRAHLASRGGAAGGAASGVTGAASADLDRAARELARVIVDTSHRGLRETWALRRLIERFPPSQLAIAPPGTSASWRRLIAKHAAAYQQSLDALAQALAFTAPSPAATVSDAAPGTVAIDVEGPRLLTLAAAIDRDVQASFRSSTADAPTEPPVKATAFWQAIADARRLAALVAAAAARPGP